MSSSSSRRTACAACSFLRRRCTPNCLFAPYFPVNNPQRWMSVHRMHGTGNATKLLSGVKHWQRGDAVKSLVYAAEARSRDPVHGCVRYISDLHERIREVQTQIMVFNQLIAAARQKQQYHQAVMPGDNFIQQGGGAVVGGNNAAVDLPVNFHHNSMPQEQLEAVVAQQQHYHAMFVTDEQQQREEMMTLNSVQREASTSQAQMQQPSQQGGEYHHHDPQHVVWKQQLAMLRNLEQQQQEMMRLNSGFPGTGGEASNSSAFGIPGGVHGGGEASTSQAQMQQQPSRQGGEYHHHVPQHVELKQQLAMLRNLEQQQEMMRLNSGFPGTGGVHGGEASNSIGGYQMQQPSQQGGELYNHHVPQHVVAEQQLAMLRNYQQQQQEMMMMRLNRGFEVFGIPGTAGVHGGETSNSIGDYQMQQQAPQQGGELYNHQHHHHDPHHPRVEAQQRRSDTEEGRSIGPLLFLWLISEIFYSWNVQLTSSCFWVQL